MKKEEKHNKETSIPITEKDVIHSKWVQEIKDKIISPIEEGTLKYSLIGLWDLCGNINDFVVEKQAIKTKEICKIIKKLKKREQKCLKNDEYPEQIIEHQNQIEMCDKILLKIKEYKK